MATTDVMSIHGFAYVTKQIEFLRPIIVINMPRTGSTAVHRAIAADDRWVAPRTWEMEHSHDLFNPEIQGISLFKPRKCLSYINMGSNESSAGTCLNCFIHVV